MTDESQTTPDDDLNGEIEIDDTNLPAVQGLTDEDREGLTPEELAALEGDDEDDGEDDGDGDEGGSDDDTAPAPIDTASDPAPAVVVAAPAAAPAAAAPVPGADPLPLEVVQQINARVGEALAAKLDVAFTRYEDGEITADEYKAETRQINASAAAARSEAEADHRHQAYRTVFAQAANAYQAQNPALWTPEHVTGFDRHVRAVTGNPAYDKMSPQQKLEAAHRLYASEADILGRTAPPVPGKTAAPAPKATVPPRPKGEAPVTLANIPAASANNASEGRFAALDRMVERGDSAGAEAMMAKLSDSERDAYLASA